MFLNLATEYITLYATDEEIVIPYDNVEEYLTKTIVELYRTYTPSTLYVLNGPGSFTNLRVGALVANMIRMLTHGACTIKMIDKLSLYRYAYHQGIIPSSLYLFIGQRKNLRYYHLNNDRHEVIQKTDPDLIGRINSVSRSFQYYAVDRLFAKDFEIFVGHPGMIQMYYRDQKVMLSYGGEQLDCTDIFEPVESVDPFYGFESY